LCIFTDAVSSFILVALLLAQSSHVMDQVSYRIRGYIIHRIHARSILPADSRILGSTESAKVTVLANVDVANAVVVLKMFGEILTSGITVGVGAYLLFDVIGIVFIGPLVLALISVAVPVMLGDRLTNSQRRSLEATEKRLHSLSQLVANTRSIRIGGVQEIASEEVLSYRRLEINAASMYRKIFILVVLAGKLFLRTKPLDHPLITPMS
jgi:ATP-binding cassette, subfamily C (CFTR/MRP), member 1